MQEGAGLVAGLLAELGVPTTALSRLLAHADAVARDSPRLGLVSSGDEGLILRRHTADSLLFALARAPLPGERWVDVGSGGGFPGVVLACCFPAAHFTLVESNKRKAGFLEIQCLELGLKNAEVIPSRAETVTGRFDVAVTRAVADPKDAADLLVSMLGPGGEAIVAGAGSVRGAREVRVDRPDVDSPGLLLMIAAEIS